MRVPRYVPESPELIQAREWEENTRWQTSSEANLAFLDLSKDWTMRGVRCGVSAFFSHAYDAKVAA